MGESNVYMIEKIMTIYQKHKEKLLYLIFGGLTTVVDWTISFSLYYFWGDQIDLNPILVHTADAIAWVCAVAFAYITNRIWVFESRTKGFASITKEVVSFAGGRVLTFFMQEGFVALFVTWLGMNKYVIRVVAAVLVIVANYFISKLIVFRKKKDV